MVIMYNLGAKARLLGTKARNAFNQADISKKTLQVLTSS